MKVKYIFYTLILSTALLAAACSPNVADPEPTGDKDSAAISEVMDGGETMQEIDAEIVEVVPAEQVESTEVEVLAVDTEMPDEPMQEDIPGANTEDDWILISQGQFRGADASHQSSGKTSIYQKNEQRVLRFEEFVVTDGPDLHVLLVENTTAADHEAIGNYIDLGKLKGSSGSQEYEINHDVDLSQYQGVMIYCEPFEVVFATAPLGN